MGSEMCIRDRQCKWSREDVAVCGSVTYPEALIWLSAAISVLSNAKQGVVAVESKSLEMQRKLDHEASSQALLTTHKTNA